MKEQIHGNILVVDDNISNLHLLVTMLSKHGNTISVARSGEEAIEISKKTPLDLVLLDIMMPGMDGYTTCEVLKAMPNTRGIPIIFLSALDDVESKTKGFHVGGVDYVSKPFNESEVIARINTHLSLSKTRHNLEESINQISLIEEELRQNYNEIVAKEREVLESEKKFRTIFSLVPNPILITKISDGTVMDCNRAMTDLIGMPQTEIIGTTTLNLQIWGNLESRQRFLDELVQNGSIDNREMHWKRNLSEPHILLFSSRIVEIAGEKVIITVGFDYTAQKKAEQSLIESEEMYRNPVEQSPVGVFLYQDGVFRYSNPRLAMMFGYNRDAIQSLPIDNLIFDLDLIRIKKILNNPCPQQLSETLIEFKGVKSSGTILDMELYASHMCYQGRPAIYGTIIDVTYRNLIEEARYQSEKMYRLITENMKDVVCILDYETWSFLYVSPSIKKLSGYISEEILTHSVSEILTPKSSSALADLLHKEHKTFRKNPGSHGYNQIFIDLVKKDGKLIQTEFTTSFLTNSKDGRIEVLCVIQDISERLKIEADIEVGKLELFKKNEALVAANEELLAAEENQIKAYNELAQNQNLLIEQEAALRNAQSIAHLGNLEWRISDNRIYVSEEFCKIFDIPCSECIKTFEDCLIAFDKDSRYRFFKAVDTLRTSGSFFSDDFQISLQDGTNKVVRGLGEAKLDTFGRIDRISLIVFDITRQNQMEKDLTDANLEKEILLKEIHHRVKNNMQVISSLLSMQSRSIQEPSIQTIFRETQTRVRSLSLVHELLYKSDSLKNIDYRKYLSELSKYIFNSHNPTNRDINCIISENDVQISIEKAIPCSLVITELLTNSLKYAFIDGQKGEIKIDFRYESQSDEFILLYQDNGVGFLPGTDPRTPAGFGSTLINGLTRQLSGTITIKDGNPGVRYTLKFPKDK